MKLSVPNSFWSLHPPPNKLIGLSKYDLCIQVFGPLKLKLYSLNNNSPFPDLPAPGNHCSTPRFICMLYHMSGILSFLRLNNIPLYLCIRLPWRLHLQCRRLSAVQETPVQSLGQEEALEKETYWQPTPVFLSGKSHGQGAWWATVHGVARVWHDLGTKSPPPLPLIYSIPHFTYPCIHWWLSKTLPHSGCCE